jgi:hypothetical protein
MYKLSSILGLVVVLLYGCASHQIYKVDKDLEEYFAAPYAKTVINCSPDNIHNPSIIRVRFTKEGEHISGYAGLCRMNSAFFEIVINRKHWNLYNERLKHTIMHHEIGHCVLKLEHNNKPKHFMNSHVYSMPEEILNAQFEEELNKC